MKYYPKSLLFGIALSVACIVSADARAEEARGTVVTESFVSEILADAQTGLDPERVFQVYLPSGYSGSEKRYPVIYHLHSVFQRPEQTFADGNMQRILERAFANGIIGEAIVVVGDFTSPTTGSLYENSESTGRWLDYAVEELAPFVDGKFRTLPRPESRALTGEMMGGRGALALAMRHPDVFGSVYALNPVGTGEGHLPIESYPNWQKILNAKSPEDLEGDHISQIFITMSQAFLANPERPPFYCDFIMELENGQPTYQPDNVRKLVAGFSLAHQLDEYAPNMRKLRGIAYDWSRYDPIYDHVFAAQDFTRALDSYGIDHEAEEYRGRYWIENWKEYGRYYARALPFLARHLEFE